MFGKAALGEGVKVHAKQSIGETDRFITCWRWTMLNQCGKMIPIPANALGETRQFEPTSLVDGIRAGAKLTCNGPNCSFRTEMSKACSKTAGELLETRDYVIAWPRVGRDDVDNDAGAIIDRQMPTRLAHERRKTQVCNRLLGISKSPKVAFGNGKCRRRCWLIDTQHTRSAISKLNQRLGSEVHVSCGGGNGLSRGTILNSRAARTTKDLSHCSAINVPAQP